MSEELRFHPTLFCEQEEVVSLTIPAGDFFFVIHSNVIN